MLAALSSTLTAHDPSTAAHAARVTLLAGRLAGWLGWDERRLAALDLGARLHDIGKVAIREEILSKRGPLDPDELAEVHAHPIVGAKLLASLGQAQEALPCVLYHHERWDGGGYPTGRGGEEIPADARLLSVTDAFDAMTSNRPYRRALSPGRALDEIERCAGTQFDPLLAGAFLEAWDEGALSTPQIVAI